MKELTTSKQKRAYADRKAKDLEFLVKMRKIKGYCAEMKELYIAEPREIVRLDIKHELMSALNDMCKDDCQIRENIDYLRELE